MLYNMDKILIAVTTLSGLTFGLMVGLLRVDTPISTRQGASAPPRDVDITQFCGSM